MPMEGEKVVRVQETPLHALVEGLLRASGADEPSAEATARAVVDASARGVDTHGVRLVPRYCQAVNEGRITQRPNVRFERLAPSAGSIDADHGFGHLASYRAVEHGVELARETGCAMITVKNSSHFGAAGCYARAAALQGIAAIGGAHADPFVVPHDGVKPFYSTNPLTFATPVADAEPLLLDMATSSIPFNRVLLRRVLGESLPPGVAVDANGDMTTDAEAAAYLLPLGGTDYGYKGAALAAVIDILSSAFAGMPHGNKVPGYLAHPFSERIPVGHFFIFIDPSKFMPMPLYYAAMQAFLDDLRSQPAHPGKSVMAPGDPEIAYAAERRANGVPVDLTTWGSFKTLAEHYGLALPETLA